MSCRKKREFPGEKKAGERTLSPSDEQMKGGPKRWVSQRNDSKVVASPKLTPTQVTGHRNWKPKCEGPSKPGRERAIPGRLRAASPHASPGAPEARTPQPRRARGRSQQAGPRDPGLSRTVRGALASRLPLVGRRKPSRAESGGAVTESTESIQGDEPEAADTLDPEAEIPANRK